MFTSTDPAFKKAAIDWLLSVGECSEPFSSTDQVLFDLADRGIDYDASTMPDFTTVCTDPGDTDTQATFGKGIGATIVPVGARQGSYGRGESYDFRITEAEMMSIIVGHVIMGVIQAATSGEPQWKGRYPERRRWWDERKAAEKARQEAAAARAQ